MTCTARMDIKMIKMRHPFVWSPNSESGFNWRTTPIAYIYNIYYILYIYCLVTMVKPLNLMFEREIVGSRRMTFEVVPTSPWADAKAALLDFFRSLLFGTARRDGSAGAGTAQKMGKFWHPRNKHQRSRWVHRLPWKSVALFRSWPLAKSGEVAINKRLPQWSSYCSSD